MPLMGVSPIACGAPGPKNGKDFILDMAPSIAARGKIYKALRRGESIPDDWALDNDGRMTVDPKKALEGVMLPMGGPKGSALAVMSMFLFF
jgi:LDH2 family malate/lactate/ureidoglycolate dehydrogenase